MMSDVNARSWLGAALLALATVGAPVLIGCGGSTDEPAQGSAAPAATPGPATPSPASPSPATPTRPAADPHAGHDMGDMPPGHEMGDMPPQ